MPGFGRDPQRLTSGLRYGPLGRATANERGKDANAGGQPGSTAGLPMKERGYLVVAGLIGLAIVADLALNRGLVAVFLVRELMRLVEYLSFWR